MRISLIIFGVIFLVVGGLLYIYPSPTFGAQTNTAGTDGTDIRTSSATLDIPVVFSIALLIIGGIFFLLGLVIPGSVKTVQGKRGPRGSQGRVSVQRFVKRRKGILARGTTVTTTRKIVRKRK